MDSKEKPAKRTQLTRSIRCEFCGEENGFHDSRIAHGRTKTESKKEPTEGR